MKRSSVAPILAILLAVPTAACGDETTRGRALAETVAHDFRKQCESAHAPDEAMRRHLVRLCRCAEARIAATPMRWGESDASVNQKVQAAMNACYARLGGAPGAGRR
ncbi:MAG: hypothetical protein ACJ8ER_03085 [Allosphingosinicella sp.]